jgi:hypothetical protein
MLKQLLAKQAVSSHFLHPGGQATRLPSESFRYPGIKSSESSTQVLSSEFKTNPLSQVMQVEESEQIKQLAEQLVSPQVSAPAPPLVS